MGLEECQSCSHPLDVLMNYAALDVLNEYAACKCALVYVGLSLVRAI